MHHVAVFRIEAGKIQHHFFRIRLHGLRGFELFFGLFGVVLDGVKLAENHAIGDAGGLQGDDLFELGDGLVKHGAAGRGGCGGVLLFAERAQVDASEEAVGIDVVGRGFEQFTCRVFGLTNMVRVKIEIGQGVIQRGRVGIGIERKFVLFDGARHIFGVAFGGVFFIDGGQAQMIVGLEAIGCLRGRFGGCGLFGWGKLNGADDGLFGGRGGLGQRGSRASRKTLGRRLGLSFGRCKGLRLGRGLGASVAGHQGK